MGSSLSFKNMARKPGRSAALVILSMFLAFSVLAGTLLISGFRSGLDSLETRLGADIMVVPYEATTKSSFSNMILQGSTGYFYMDRSIYDKIAAMDGIGQISEQFYLASTTSSCCSTSVEIIGYNPETDFTISPWIKSSYSSDLGYLEILVGNDLNAFAGDTLRFYGVDVTVKARLDRTGTYLDTAVYASEETIKTLIRSAQEKGMFDFGDVDPDSIVSCVLVDVAEDAVIEEVVGNINLYCKGVKAIQTEAFITDVTDGLKNISGMIGGLVIAIWVLAVVILCLAFTLISNERKKEFAVLRVIGASRKMLTGIIMKEALMISCLGSVIGAVLAALLVNLLSGHIESSFGMPFLLPGIPGMIALILGAIVLSIAAGSLSAAFSAHRISKIDTALILRGDN